MMRWRSLCTALCTMFVVLGCHSPGNRSFDNEVLLAIDRWSGVATVAAGEASQDVQADIDEFIQAIQELEIPPSDLDIASSPDGRTVAVRDRRSGFGGPVPTWIWPSWQDSERVIEIEDSSLFYFASNSDVVCGRYLIDVCSGSRRRLPDEWHRHNVFKVDESGNWWAVRTRAGALLVGSLEDGFSSDQPALLDNLADYDGPEFIGETPFVAVFRRGELHIIDVRSRSTAFTTHVIEPGGLIHRVGSRAIIVGEWLLVVESSANGDFETAHIRKLRLRQRERVTRPSPSGKYVAVFEDLLWPPSGVVKNVVATPLASPDKQGIRMRVDDEHTFSISGWLSWKAEDE